MLPLPLADPKTNRARASSKAQGPISCARTPG
jgi:hypothetical protein